MQKNSRKINVLSRVKARLCPRHVNEKWISLSELQAITDDVLKSAQKYAKVAVQRKKELMERKGISNQ